MFKGHFFLPYLEWDILTSCKLKFNTYAKIINKKDKNKNLNTHVKLWLAEK